MQLFESILGYLFAPITLWMKMFEALVRNREETFIIIAAVLAFLAGFIFGAVAWPTQVALVYVIGIFGMIMSVYYYKKFQQPGLTAVILHSLLAAVFSGIGAVMMALILVIFLV